MATQRPIKTSMWNDPRFSDLDIAEKTLVLYLFTNERTLLSGLYSISLRQISSETGFNKDEVEKLFKRLSDRNIAYYHNNYNFVFVNKFYEYQSINDKSIQAGCKREIESVKQELLTWVMEISTEAPPSRSTLLNLTIPNLTKLSSDEKNNTDEEIAEANESNDSYIDLQTTSSSSLKQEEKKESEKSSVKKEKEGFGCEMVSDFLSGYDAICKGYGILYEADRKHVGWFINTSTGETGNTKKEFVSTLGAENCLDAIDKLYIIAGKIKWGGGYSKINSLSGIHYNRKNIIEKAKAEGISIKKKIVEIKNPEIPILYTVN